MTSTELRSLYLKFFKTKQHTIIDSASLIPENDPTVLFITAGMQPLVPYLLGEKHPAGRRLTDAQKCLRTDDIEYVGDSSHLTYFEMLGNWSLGDYFKKTSIRWSYEFLFSPEWLGLDKSKIAFSVFAGDKNCPKDTESASCWISMGISPDKIFYLPAENNWWGPAGITGPCGPDTEMFIDTGKPACGPDCSPACDCGKYIEFWNNVFMEYLKKADGSFVPLPQKNVDTGMGLERMLCIVNNSTDVYQTDLFDDSIRLITELSGKKYGKDPETTKAFRIIADHMRSATFVLGDRNGITPSNVEQGYVLRRIIRRAVRYMKKLGIPDGSCAVISNEVIEKYGSIYPELKTNRERIIDQLNREEERFGKTLKQGEKEFYKLVGNDQKAIDGYAAFHLYDTFGFPIEFTVELAKESGATVDEDAFRALYKEHQEKSKQGAVKRFQGGLADHTVETARLHTAAHLLQYALRKVLDQSVEQRGCNITAERLRFDFSFPRKLTMEEIDSVENIVNDIILENVPVSFTEMSLEEAHKSGAIGLFDNKYNQVVKVYSIGEYSKEICGGPHASSSGELGKFKILKEESSSSGVRRIKAVLS